MTKIQPVCCGKDMDHIYHAAEKKTAGWYCWVCNGFKKAGPIGEFININSMYMNGDHVDKSAKITHNEE